MLRPWGASVWRAGARAGRPGLEGPGRGEVVRRWGGSLGGAFPLSGEPLEGRSELQQQDRT